MRLCLIPIIAQFTFTKFGPVEHEPEGPTLKLSLNDFQRFDSDLRLVLYRKSRESAAANGP